MTEEKRRHKTTIAGRPYTIIASKTPEHLQAVADLVEEQISQIQKAMPVLDIEQRSVLVAVNAVSQSLDRQQELDQLKERIAQLEKEREELLHELRVYEELLEEYLPEEEQYAAETDLDGSAAWSSGRHLASQERQAELKADSSPSDEREENNRSQAVAKKANLRFVRPTTASQALLQQAEMVERQNHPSRAGESLSRTRRNRKNTTDHNE